MNKLSVPTESLPDVGVKISGSVRVIKLGGSLLSDPQLVAHLRRWISQDQTSTDSHDDSPLIWIIGGGLLADAIRHWDRLHELGERPCHELCLQLMSTTARIGQQILSAALPQPAVVPLLTSWQSLRDWLAEPRSAARMAVFDVGRVLLQEPSTEQAAELAASWQVTSDSLAAWVATRLQATQLTLLKSCPPPDPPTRATAVREGIVDESFAALASALPRVTFVQLVSSTTKSLDCD